MEVCPKNWELEIVPESTGDEENEESGYFDVYKDFQVAFENGDGLMKKWEPDFEKIVSFLKSDGHMKDKSVECLLEKIKEESIQQFFDACESTY
ncbi:hypothetical protein JTB14_004306 [Gonioctena quinquepunctata]|nr:hypothetical protein JTB14_004306 [Gonioctena quinquepunctata]